MKVLNLSQNPISVYTTPKQKTNLNSGDFTEDIKFVVINGIGLVDDVKTMSGAGWDAVVKNDPNINSVNMGKYLKYFREADKVKENLPILIR